MKVFKNRMTAYGKRTNTWAAKILIINTFCYATGIYTVTENVFLKHCPAQIGAKDCC